MDPEGHRFLLKLEARKSFHSSHGMIKHTEIIGTPEGDRVATNIGKHLLVIRPTYEEYVFKMRRRSQIIYPKDVAMILVRGDVRPGARVVEVGIGSGALALALVRMLGPAGHLVSYEAREDMAATALKNIADFVVDGATHEVKLRDAYEGIDETDVDLMTVDLPEPHRMVGHAAGALRMGGSLLCWLPTALQVFDLANALRDDRRFDLIETVEILERPWYTGPRSLRPEHRMVAHTGFLVSARRTAERIARDAGADDDAGLDGEAADDDRDHDPPHD